MAYEPAIITKYKQQHLVDQKLIKKVVKENVFYQTMFNKFFKKDVYGGNKNGNRKSSK